MKGRRKRENVALQHKCNADATYSNGVATKCNTEKDKETDIESDKEEEGTGTDLAFGIYRNVFLTSPEMESLKERFPDSYKGKIDHLSAYLKSTGRKYKNHYLTICRWDDREKKEASKDKGKDFPDYSKVKKEGTSY